ncbi:hypothetical protein vBPpSSYP_40 [Pseudomonas phage vB_PpS_SYP]|nr:hypothetical protein vBPpSSYP_40 [Pseudomonas phage vB_PpS_SYP]
MKIITVWTVHETIDEYGRIGKLLGITRTAEEAKALARGKGWYGCSGHWTSCKAIVDPLDNAWLLVGDGNPTAFYDDVERKRKEREQLREKAIAKLTEEELALILEGVKK